MTRKKIETIVEELFQYGAIAFIEEDHYYLFKPLLQRRLREEIFQFIAAHTKAHTLTTLNEQFQSKQLLVHYLFNINR